MRKLQTNELDSPFRPARPDLAPRYNIRLDQPVEDAGEILETNTEAGETEAA